MKRAIYLSICLLLLSGLPVTNSCKKDAKIIKGCTDKDSKNYDPTANEDDGSCTYEGKVVIWYDPYTGNIIYGQGAITLDFYLDGQDVARTAPYNAWTSAPFCGQNQTITVTKDLGNIKTKAYRLIVKDQTGYVYWDLDVNFNANTCLQYKLSGVKQRF